MNKTTVFNVFSGTIQEVLTSDIFLLGHGYLPLTKTPKSCKKCNNRLYVGRDTSNLTYPPCSCVQKVLNFDILKELENKLSQHN